MILRLTLVAVVSALVSFLAVNWALPQRHIPARNYTTISGLVCDTVEQAKANSTRAGCQKVVGKDVVVIRTVQAAEPSEDPETARARAEEYTRRLIVDPYARLTESDRLLKEMAIRDAGFSAYQAALDKQRSAIMEIELVGENRVKKFAVERAIATHTTAELYIPSTQLRNTYIAAGTAVPIAAFLLYGFLAAPQRRSTKRELSLYEIDEDEASALLANASPELFRLLMHFGVVGSTADTRDLPIFDGSTQNLRNLQGKLTRHLRAATGDPTACMMTAKTNNLADGTVYAILSISEVSAQSLHSAYSKYTNYIDW